MFFFYSLLAKSSWSNRPNREKSTIIHLSSGWCLCFHLRRFSSSLSFSNIVTAFESQSDSFSEEMNKNIYCCWPFKTSGWKMIPLTQFVHEPTFFIVYQLHSFVLMRLLMIFLAFLSLYLIVNRMFSLLKRFLGEVFPDLNNLIVDVL